MEKNRNFVFPYSRINLPVPSALIFLKVFRKISRSDFVAQTSRGATLFIFFFVFTYQLINLSTSFAFDWGYAREDGGMPGAYLSWGAGARSLAMGKAYVGLSDDASAVYWNPAGLTQSKEKEFSALYSSLWEKTNYSFVAYSQPIIRGKGQGSRVTEEGARVTGHGSSSTGENTAESLKLNAGSEKTLSTYFGSIGVALVNLGSTGFEERNEYNEPGGKTGLSETAGIISYAKKLSVDVSAGINLKIANQRVDTYSDTGYGVDVGFLWRPGDRIKLLNNARWLTLLFFPTTYTPQGTSQIPPIVKYLEPLSVGLSIQNLIAPRIKLKDQTDKFPFAVRLGLGYKLLNDKITLAVDADKTENRSVKMHYGVEFSPYNIFDIRMGLDETEVTAGFGVELAGINLDYAFAYHNAWKGHDDLGNSHRFGLTYRWGGLKTEGDDKLISRSPADFSERLQKNQYAGDRYVDKERQREEVIAKAEDEIIVTKGYVTEQINEQQLKERIKEEVEKQTKEPVNNIKIEKIEEIIPAESKQYISTYQPINVLTIYTVVNGDCLWNIAKKPEVYNNPLEWNKIYEANQDKIKDSNLIYPGQELVIPRDMGSEAK